MDEQTRKKVDAEIANIIAMSIKLGAETSKTIAETNKTIAETSNTSAETAKAYAEVGKIRAEVDKLSSENRYYPIIVTATATLAIVGLARLFFGS